MTAFDPKPEYEIQQRAYRIKEFSEFKEEFVKRPPYQRKNVWSRKKRRDLLDSLFRQYYVPRIVLREVRLDEESTLFEVIDGQQRIDTAQLFMEDELALPKTLEDVHPALPGSYFSDLSAEIRRFISRDIKYTADIVKGLENPKDPQHLNIATEIFWRLQQGETLNYMEIAHSRLSSLARNFVVKYADDQGFDYKKYQPVNHNPSKHRFFDVITRENNRMQHLALLTRFMMIEEADGPTEIQRKSVGKFIDKFKEEDGIDNLDFKETEIGKSVLQTMHLIYEIFEDDPMVESGEGMKELSTEYVLISMYTLVRHLSDHYVLENDEKRLIREFTKEFHGRWRARREDDPDILEFADKRQQSGAEIDIRHRIIRQLFFEYANEQNHEMMTKDKKRSFNEADRIRIYRRDNGLCQECLAQELPEEEALVPWEEFEADHVIPHARGGKTELENAQLLCKVHNRRKGAN